MKTALKKEEPEWLSSVVVSVEHAVEEIPSCHSQRYHKILPFPVVSLLFCDFNPTVLLLQPGFLNLCEQWCENLVSVPSVVCDVYGGKLWQEFMVVSGIPFLAIFCKYNLAFMLNVDWFQPFEHRTYSVGVMYLSVMN